MQIEVNIPYGRDRFCYEIRKESHGIYHAHMKHDTEEESKACPPREITLIRGVRRWSGSIDDRSLLNMLGETIDKSQSPAPKK